MVLFAAAPPPPLLPPRMLLLTAKLGSVSLIGLGGLSGFQAVTAPAESNSVFILSLGSIVSIGLGFYWYGRLTEKVQTQKESQAKQDARIKALEDGCADGARVDLLDQKITRMSNQLIRLSVHFKVPVRHDDSPDFSDTLP